MNTGWNKDTGDIIGKRIINLLGNEYWLEPDWVNYAGGGDYKPTGK